MLPREDGGVVDNKLKASGFICGPTVTTTTKFVDIAPAGIRHDECPRHGHFDHPASHWSAYAG
jgi:hypothetical protein